MNKATILKVKLRDRLGRSVNNLRKSSMIPAVLYGHGIANKNLMVDNQQFYKVYNDAGGTSLIDLVIEEEKPIKAVIHEIQSDPLTDKISHIDFYQVKMSEEINAELELKLVGESKAVKELGGTLFKAIPKLPIKCLPGDLIHDIEVDISALNTFDDIIRIKDLKIPEKIKVMIDLEEVVAKVNPPRTEEELKELETEVKEDLTTVEKVGAKPEEEATEETAEAAEEEKK